MNKWSGRSNVSRPVIGIGIVVFVYVYFLIFAQFAFLRLASAHSFAPNEIRAIMFVMGLAGIAASIGTALRLHSCNVRWMLCAGFVGGAAAAGLAVVSFSLATFCIVSALIGLSVGTLTVTLASTLPRLFGTPSIGLFVGIGTGLAYAICNVPAVFGTSPAFQAGFAGFTCLIGLIAVTLANFDETPSGTSKEDTDPRKHSFAMLVIMFLSLVWLDSAAFYILQNTPALNRFGWSSAALQWQNAGIHFAAAVIAGWLIDRGGLARLPFAAVVCLAGAAICVSSDREMFARSTHWLYAAGVSLYSVALVCTPTVQRSRDIHLAARRSAVLFSVAGWLGSALGIGMAQDLHTIPGWFIGLASGVVVLANFHRFRSMYPSRISTVGILLIVTGGVMAFHNSSRHSESAPGEHSSRQPSALFGRETYIAEGCIHCHSQYVRPQSTDEQWWGPVRSPAEILHQAPPLIGNRRQGPDLLNAGNRRSALWNRIHLMDPRSVSPSSVMPSYAYLFRRDDPRGESLLLYLAELGADSFGNRLNVRATWSPKEIDSAEPELLGRTLFNRHCAQCHGTDGTGNGILTRELAPWQPRNLRLAEWTQLTRHTDVHRERVELARVIKFGILGTPMAGHETWGDHELLSIAKYVQSLASKPLE